MVSVIIICGVDITEQHMVLMQLDKKSNPGPAADETRTFFFVFDFELFVSSLCWIMRCSTIMFMRRRTNSNTAKLSAPCGTDKRNCAPAPRVNNFQLDGCANVRNVTVSPTTEVRTPFAAAAGLLDRRFACNIVFIVFMGCTTTCATDREIAPQTIFSQNTRFRPCTPPPPPFNFDMVCFCVATVVGLSSNEASAGFVEES
mmetsp:Transcript_28141/g.40291  ORF Transcript_28141/g.40291 Transcript_28141/m.40291 type:complete len:201 (+) Transcript_28141:729-1331(+)